MFYSSWGQYGTFNRAANSSNFPDRSSDFLQPHWMPDNPINDYARIGSKNIGNNYLRKSFVRWENITLSYNLPKDFAQKMSLQNMRLSLSVRNVGVFSPDWNFWDPENSDPAPRTFNASINITL